MKISNNSASTLPKFELGSHQLQEINGTRDIGVFFESNLSFNTHISNVIANAKKRLFLLQKSFIAKDPTVLMLAYKTCIAYT